MKNMIITDANRAFSSLLEESTIGQNFNLIVSTLTSENGKYWESLATFIDGLEEFKPRELELLKIIEIGEQALLNEDLENENNKLGDRVMELENAFDTLKGDCCDRLEEIESDLENTIGNDELDSVLDELKELKEDVKNHRWIVENADDF